MEDRSKEMAWVLIACGLRIILQEVVQDIKEGKLIVKPSSSLTQVAVQTRIKQLDNLMFKLIPNPNDNANPFESIDVGEALKDKKGKKLN